MVILINSNNSKINYVLIKNRTGFPTSSKEHLARIRLEW